MKKDLRHDGEMIREYVFMYAQSKETKRSEELRQAYRTTLRTKKGIEEFDNLTKNFDNFFKFDSAIARKTFQSLYDRIMLHDFPPIVRKNLAQSDAYIIFEEKKLPPDIEHRAEVVKELTDTIKELKFKVQDAEQKLEVLNAKLQEKQVEMKNLVTNLKEQHKFSESEIKEMQQGVQKSNEQQIKPNL